MAQDLPPQVVVNSSALTVLGALLSALAGGMVAMFKILISSKNAQIKELEEHNRVAEENLKRAMIALERALEQHSSGEETRRRLREALADVEDEE